MDKITYEEMRASTKLADCKLSDFLLALSESDKPLTYGAFNRQNKPTLKNKTRLALVGFLAERDKLYQAISQHKDNPTVKAQIYSLLVLVEGLEK